MVVVSRARMRCAFCTVTVQFNDGSFGLIFDRPGVCRLCPALRRFYHILEVNPNQTSAVMWRGSSCHGVVSTSFLIFTCTPL